MRSLGETQVRNRVAFQAVRATLEQDEFGLGGSQIGFHLAPGRAEFVVFRARRQRNIELRAFRRPEPVSDGGTCTRIEIATIFVNVGERSGPGRLRKP